MKKQILNLGKLLTKKEQCSIHGGFLDMGLFDDDGSCEAVCDNGDTIPCSGEDCSAVDGLGCFWGEIGNRQEDLCKIDVVGF